MTSRERVRAAILHQNPDRVPAAFEAVGTVNRKLMEHYGFTEYDQLLEKFEIDVVPVGPRYIGPELPVRKNEKGETVTKSFWGYETTEHVTDIDTYGVTTFFPLNGVESIEDVKAQYTFPDPDWFDYASLKEQCDRYPDKALIMGHEGPFQIVTYLIEMDQFFMLMVDEPETAKYILDKMVEFELEYYRRCFEAVPGRIDILRPHDDYGTQISLLFSVDMLREKFDGKITFHGGIDTQGVLPYGTPEEVERETRLFIDTLGEGGGYILMASQAFEGDVPVANIEALYSADRHVHARPSAE